ncbi:methyltransferase domain-containing protein [Verminephrobacter eiseniae]|uniref:methyltransferase domain-containing protein n=1 Tax=Verminephrobacter eiseniae TaxID=364317 RepID=UPI00223704AE|nr:methyltransferase domain-containing protein [Verminephrobacter eiseniae]
MTHSTEDLHVYLRSITEGERTSLSVLARLVPENATVLDLGCGSGALGRFLAGRRACTSDGLTLSEAEAAHARPHYRRVVVDDLESCDLQERFAGQRYDTIVCADVLEHLRRPERVLAACRELLKPAGRLLISVPNAGYCGLVAELLQGEFRYRQEGLLDRTHLRFFTHRSLLRWLNEQRWALDSLDRIVRQLPESEFQVAFDSLPPAVARYLLGMPDALCYQFIAVARPVAVPAQELHFLDAAVGATAPGQAQFVVSPGQAQLVAPPDQAQLAAPPGQTQLAAPPGQVQSMVPPGQARFTAQLYLGRDGQYTEARKLTTTGAIGAERQTLRFVLPAQDEALTQLRLDPADRAGFLHLYRITLRSAQGDVVWEWHAHGSPRSLLAATVHHQIVWQAPMPAASGATLLLLTGEEPWFELPIAPATLAACTPQEATLDIELGWPMSADYLALSATVCPLQDRIAALESSTSDAQRRLHQAQSRSAGLEENNQALAQQCATWQLEATRLRQDCAQLVQHLKTIETSTVFRATRPLVHAKMRIDRLLGRTPRQRAAPQAVPIAAPDHPVDIIVPVYQGLADTQRCLASVLSATCHSAYRLIVIDDASPEPALSAWLRQRAAQDSRITLLENPENLGFVGTVNRGMALSDSHDVLLLNSDTEVTGDWLDRLRRAAYGDRKIASVTPLSNNATICSYPRFCQANELPAGYDSARLDALCAQTNPGAVVDVPTGVGFCMYIRRDCLKQLGLFDSENFGKGYGEENDFCQRAAKAGWRNLQLLDTFVLHTGGVSFGDSKSQRERAALQTLRRLHPGYESAVMAFVQADPARPYRLALDTARIVRSGLPVVLAVLHDRAGGTLRHVRDLAQHLSGQALFLTLTPAPGRSVSLQLACAGEGFELVFRLADQYQDLLQTLRQLGVRHVHYHHLLGHDPLIAGLPHALGLAYDFTAHDFYSYCTHISLTGSDHRYADGPAPGQCACCRTQEPAPSGSGSVADWRQRNRHFLVAARNLLVPSHDAARRMAAFAPGARLRVVPHADISADGAAALSVIAPPPRPADARLKIVVLGALSAIKGADLLEAVALQAARRQAPVEFHLLGYGYRHLQTQPRARLTVHGAYEDPDLPGLLHWLQPDLVWFPALWPETYSYTLSAALQAGLPVVAPDLGAFAERLAGRPWSWVMPWDMTAAEWLERFLELRQRHFANAQAPQPPTHSAPASDDWHYRQHYLQGLPDIGAPSPLAHDFLRSHQPPTAAARRSLLLTGLVRLRSHPLLRGLAQRVPQHWQTRVKNWLRA